MRSGLLAILAAMALAGCDHDPSPLQREPLRLGADRQVTPSGRLPGAGTTGGYEGSAAPTDPSTQVRIGSAVPEAGGQQAQKAKDDKAIADIKEKWERERAGAAVTTQPPA